MCRDPSHDTQRRGGAGGHADSGEKCACATSRCRGRNVPGDVAVVQAADLNDGDDGAEVPAARAADRYMGEEHIARQWPALSCHGNNLEGGHRPSNSPTDASRWGIEPMSRAAQRRYVDVDRPQLAHRRWDTTGIITPRWLTGACSTLARWRILSTNVTETSGLRGSRRMWWRPHLRAEVKQTDHPQQVLPSD